jgi:hypothetical protein
MRDIRLRETAVELSLLAVVLAGAAGCKVQVDKNGDGDDKNVKIVTPFGNIAVNKGQSSAAEVGLPLYPGATDDRDGDGEKSARVDLGFGSFKLKVRVAHYATSDSRDQVVAFYRKALGSYYGTVIECADGHPVGLPVRTEEGLTCDHSAHDGSDTGRERGADELELKAGSDHRQHIVSVKPGGGSRTQFSLIAVELPHGMDDEQKGTN